MSGKSRTFTSLKSSIASAQRDRQLPTEIVLDTLRAHYQNHIEVETVLHFATPGESLGPGRLINFDLERETVSIQLRGEGHVREYSFENINDFGNAEYDKPNTYGETLIAAFWDARANRKYLERMVANAYARLSPEEIESFGQISAVSEIEVANLVPLNMAEMEVKQHICSIIGYPFVQKDWGGEACDIFASVQFRRRTVPAAFLLKGKAYAHKPLRLADLGKNGDQLVRMFSLPAQIFIIQSNGPIDGAVHSQIQAQIADRLLTNRPAYYLVIDGIQTARLLRAYGKI